MHLNFEIQIFTKLHTYFKDVPMLTNLLCIKNLRHYS